MSERASQNSGPHDDQAPKDKSQDNGGQGNGQEGQGGGGDKPGGGEEKKKKPNPLKNPKVLVIGAVVIVVLAIGGFLYWLHARQYVSTDDAFVDTHIVRLAPQVPGAVSRVLVEDDAPVKPGQVLVEIDASSARNALEQALAQKSEAIARLAQAQAQAAASEATWRQSREQAAGLAATAENADRDARRLRGLQATSPRAVAAEQVDQAVAQARSADAQRDAALRQAEGALAQVRAARTQIEAAQASIQAAQAAIGQNQLTLGHTQVIAPVLGHVAQKTVAPGNYVQPGDQLMAIVPDQLWVTANFKETQLTHMKVGQPVDLSVDACPAKLHGKVASIQRGAGQAFAILPAQNATGNYVKVVQRVPVRIAFDTVPKDCPLGPGLSVEPRVKVR